MFPHRDARPTTYQINPRSLRGKVLETFTPALFRARATKHYHFLIETLCEMKAKKNWSLVIIFCLCLRFIFIWNRNSAPSRQLLLSSSPSSTFLSSLFLDALSLISWIVVRKMDINQNTLVRGILNLCFQLYCFFFCGWGACRKLQNSDIKQVNILRRSPNSTVFPTVLSLKIYDSQFFFIIPLL